MTILGSMLVLVACARPAPAGFSARDSSGVAIVENAQPRWTAGQSWRLDEARAAPLTGSDGAPAEFNGAGEAAFLADSTVVVPNARPPELRVFEPGGSLRATIGKPGGGPGEFREIARMVELPGDTLAVFDGSSSRLSLVWGGRFVGSATVTASTGGPPGSPLIRRRNGRWIFLVDETGHLPSEGIIRANILLLGANPALDRFDDTLAVLPGFQFWVHNWTKGKETTALFVRVPFGRATNLAAGSSELLFGDNDRAELRFLDPDRGVVRIIRWNATSREVTPADLQAVEQRELETATDPDWRQGLEAAFATIEAPRTAPFFDDILVAKDGTAWVREQPIRPTDSTRFAVFEPAGVWLGTVVTGPRCRLLAARSDAVLRRCLTDDDEERLALVPIRRP